MERNPPQQPEAAQTSAVRQVVWPWDAPPAPASRSANRRALAVQMIVLPAASATFYWFGHFVVSMALLCLAGFFLFLGLVFPHAHRAIERAFQRFGMWAGHMLSYVLLVPFYFCCFVPGRLVMGWRGKDPLKRTFPSPDATCWHAREPSRAADPYRRQY